MSDEKRMSWDFFSNRRKAEKEKKSRINENPKETVESRFIKKSKDAGESRINENPKETGEGMKKDGSTGARTNESNGRKGNTIQRTKKERPSEKGTDSKPTTTATGTDNQHTQEETTKKES